MINHTFFISANIISILFLLILVLAFSKREDPEQKPLSLIIACVMLLLSADTVCILLEGEREPILRKIIFGADTVCWSTSTALVAMWARYIRNNSRGRGYESRLVNVVCVSVFFANLAIVLANLFFPVLFYIDEAGREVTVPLGTNVFAAANVLAVLMCTVLLIRARKKYQKGVVTFLIAFPLAPMVAEIVILFFPELDLLCSYAVSGMLLLNLAQSDAYQRDPLTGLQNRTLLGNLLKKWVGHSGNSTICSIMIDIDGLSSTNMSYGHEAGDRKICQVASILKELPLADVCAARYGGDEFAVLWRTGNPAEMDELVNYITSRRDQLNAGGSEEERLSFSVRSFSCPGDANILASDFMRSMDVIVKEKKREIDVTIEEALEKRRFSVWYQPIRDMKSGAFTSAEALCRLKTEKDGMISPGKFIPAAEASGAIVPLGEYVLREVCAFLNSEVCRNSGICHVDVNLSIRQCSEPGEAERLVRIIDEEKIPHDRIGFEVTESATATEDSVFWDNLNVLIREGFVFSLDDFGSGYSNFHRMLSLPLDVVKLDRSLLLRLLDEKENTVLRSLVQMIHELNYSALIEGVETREQVEEIQKMGFDMVQGYFYARPMPAEALSRWRETLLPESK